MLCTSGHLKHDLFGCLAVKKQMVYPGRPVNQDTAPYVQIAQITEGTKGTLVAIFRDPNQVNIKARAEPQSSYGGCAYST